MSGGGGGGTSSNTVTQSVQIPDFEQNFAQQNQQLAQALGSQPYPTYNAPLVAGFTGAQTAGQQMALNAAGAYQPDLATAEGYTQAAAGGNGDIFTGQNDIANANATGNGMVDSAYGQIGNSTNAAWNGGVASGLNNMQSGIDVLGNATQMGPGGLNVGQYMSPYVMQSLAPQVLGLQTQLGQEQNQINAQAAGDNAFGDSRQGAEQALQNYYGNQAISGVLGQGFNTAYTNALQTGMGEQQLGLSEQQTQGQLGQSIATAGQNLGNLGLNYGQLQLGQGNAMGQLGLGENASQLAQGQALSSLGLNLGNQQLAAGAQMGNLAGLQQQLGLTGANAVYNVGQQQQNLQQQELNTAYQQYLNQVNWPFQMLNVQESALSNSPYNMVNATTLPQANMTAQGFGSGLAGLGSLAGLFSGGSGNANVAPFGGSSFPSG